MRASGAMGSIEEMLEQLDAQVKRDAHEEALATCDRVLALAPKDGDVLHTKIVCMIELGQYKEAVALIEAHDLGGAHAYECAYCLYQLGRESAALDALVSASAGESLSGREALLAAQVHYRLGEFGRAVELFREASTSSDESSSELSTNLIAALLSAGRATDACALAAAEKDSLQFEAHYNHACARIELGELAEARKLLDEALATCRESLPVDEYTEEEIEVEMGVLTAQARPPPHTHPHSHSRTLRPLAGRLRRPAPRRRRRCRQGLRRALLIQDRARAGARRRRRQQHRRLARRHVGAFRLVEEVPRKPRRRDHQEGDLAPPPRLPL